MVREVAESPGRAAFSRRAWAAGQQTRLGPDDLELLATAAWLLGRDDDSERA